MEQQEEYLDPTKGLRPTTQKRYYTPSFLQEIQRSGLEAELRLNYKLSGPEFLDLSGYGKSKYDSALNNDPTTTLNLDLARNRFLSTSDKLANGFVKFGINTFATFLDNVIGTPIGVLLGVLNAPFLAYKNLNDDDEETGFWNGLGRGLVEGYTNNIFTSAMQGARDWSEESFKNYGKKDASKQSVSEMLTDPNFWADDVLTNAGFTVGSMLSAYLGIYKNLLPLPKTALMVVNNPWNSTKAAASYAKNLFGKEAKSFTESLTEQEMKSLFRLLKQLGKLSDNLGLAESLDILAKILRTNNSFGIVNGTFAKQALNAIKSAQSEARMEAFNGYQDFIKKETEGLEDRYYRDKLSVRKKAEYEVDLQIAKENLLGKLVNEDQRERRVQALEMKYSLQIDKNYAAAKTNIKNNAIKLAAWVLLWNTVILSVSNAVDLNFFIKTLNKQANSGAKGIFIRTEENINKIKETLRKNPFMSSRQIANNTNIPLEEVKSIMNEARLGVKAGTSLLESLTKLVNTAGYKKPSNIFRNVVDKENKGWAIFKGLGLQPAKEGLEEMFLAYAVELYNLSYGKELNQIYGATIDEDAVNDLNLSMFTAGSKVLRDNWNEGFVGALTGLLGTVNFGFVAKRNRIKLLEKQKKVAEMLKLDERVKIIDDLIAKLKKFDISDYWANVAVNAWNEAKSEKAEREKVAENFNKYLSTDQNKKRITNLLGKLSSSYKSQFAESINDKDMAIDAATEQVIELSREALDLGITDFVILEVEENFKNVESDEELLLLIEKTKRTENGNTYKSIFEGMGVDEANLQLDNIRKNIKLKINTYNKVRDYIDDVFRDSISSNLKHQIAKTTTMVNDWANRLNEMLDLDMGISPEDGYTIKLRDIISQFKDMKGISDEDRTLMERVSISSSGNQLVDETIRAIDNMFSKPILANNIGKAIKMYILRNAYTSMLTLLNLLLLENLNQINKSNDDEEKALLEETNKKIGEEILKVQDAINNISNDYRFKKIRIDKDTQFNPNDAILTNDDKKKVAKEEEKDGVKTVKYLIKEEFRKYFKTDSEGYAEVGKDGNLKLDDKYEYEEIAGLQLVVGSSVLEANGVSTALFDRFDDQKELILSLIYKIGTFRTQLSLVVNNPSLFNNNERLALEKMHNYELFLLIDRYLAEIDMTSEADIFDLMVRIDREVTDKDTRDKLKKRILSRIKLMADVSYVYNRGTESQYEEGYDKEFSYGWENSYQAAVDNYMELDDLYLSILSLLDEDQRDFALDTLRELLLARRDDLKLYAKDYDQGNVLDITADNWLNHTYSIVEEFESIMNNDYVKQQFKNKILEDLLQQEEECKKSRNYEKNEEEINRLTLQLNQDKADGKPLDHLDALQKEIDRLYKENNETGEMVDDIYKIYNDPMLAFLKIFDNYKLNKLVSDINSRKYLENTELLGSIALAEQKVNRPLKKKKKSEGGSINIDEEYKRLSDIHDQYLVLQTSDPQRLANEKLAFENFMNNTSASLEQRTDVKNWYDEIYDITPSAIDEVDSAKLGVTSETVEFNEDSANIDKNDEKLTAPTLDSNVDTSKMSSSKILSFSDPTYIVADLADSLVIRKRTLNDNFMALLAEKAWLHNIDNGILLFLTNIRSDDSSGLLLNHEIHFVMFNNTVDKFNMDLDSSDKDYDLKKNTINATVFMAIPITGTEKRTISSNFGTQIKTETIDGLEYVLIGQMYPYKRDMDASKACKAMTKRGLELMLNDNTTETVLKNNDTPIKANIRLGLDSNVYSGRIEHNIVNDKIEIRSLTMDDVKNCTYRILVDTRKSPVLSNFLNGNPNVDYNGLFITLTGSKGQVWIYTLGNNGVFYRKLLITNRFNNASLSGTSGYMYDQIKALVDLFVSMDENTMLLAKIKMMLLLYFNKENEIRFNKNSDGSFSVTIGGNATMKVENTEEFKLKMLELIAGLNLRYFIDLGLLDSLDYIENLINNGYFKTDLKTLYGINTLFMLESPSIDSEGNITFADAPIVDNTRKRGLENANLFEFDATSKVTYWEDPTDRTQIRFTINGGTTIYTATLNATGIRVSDQNDDEITRSSNKMLYNMGIALVAGLKNGYNLVNGAIYPIYDNSGTILHMVRINGTNVLIEDGIDNDLFNEYLLSIQSIDELSGILQSSHIQLDELEHKKDQLDELFKKTAEIDSLKILNKRNSIMSEAEDLIKSIKDDDTLKEIRSKIELVKNKIDEFKDDLQKLGVDIKLDVFNNFRDTINEFENNIKDYMDLSYDDSLTKSEMLEKKKEQKSPFMLEVHEYDLRINLGGFGVDNVKFQLASRIIDVLKVIFSDDATQTAFANALSNNPDVAQVNSVLEAMLLLEYIYSNDDIKDDRINLLIGDTKKAKAIAAILDKYYNNPTSGSIDYQYRVTDMVVIAQMLKCK